MARVTRLQHVEPANDRIPDGTSFPRSHKLLEPQEEASLLRQLADLREKIEPLWAPLFASVSAEVRLDHFDQRLSHYHSVGGRGLKRRSELERLLAQYQEVRQKLVLANLAWVAKLAKSHRQFHVADEDLFQEGIVGFLKAIDRFEAERGLRLMTYATWYIREAMQQARAKQSHLVALSTHDQTLLGQIENERAAFQHANQRSPTPNELGCVMGRHASSLMRLQSATSPTVSLDRMPGGDADFPLASHDPSDEIERIEALQYRVSRLLEQLPSRERWIVARRFGLEGNKPHSLEELGDDLCVTKERVRQIQRQAMRRMQEKAAEFEDVLSS